MNMALHLGSLSNFKRRPDGGVKLLQISSESERQVGTQKFFKFFMVHWIRWFSHATWWDFSSFANCVKMLGEAPKPSDGGSAHDVRYTSTCSIATIVFTCLVVLLKTPSHFQGNLSEKRWKPWDLFGICGDVGKMGLMQDMLFGFRVKINMGFHTWGSSINGGTPKSPIFNHF